MRGMRFAKLSAGLALLLGLGVASVLEGQAPPVPSRAQERSAPFRRGRSPTERREESPGPMEVPKSTKSVQPSSTPNPLDESLATVTVEVVLAEWNAGKDTSKDLDELSGPTERVEAKIAALLKSGQIATLRRIRLTGQDRQTTSVNAGEMRAMVTGTATLGGGRLGRGGAGGGAAPTIRNVQYIHVGTSVTVRPRAGTSGVVLELTVEDSGLRQPADAPVLGTDDNGQAIRAAVRTSNLVTTRLKVPTGQTIVVRGSTSASKNDPHQLIVLVRARAGQMPSH